MVSLICFIFRHRKKPTWSETFSSWIWSSSYDEFSIGLYMFVFCFLNETLQVEVIGGIFWVGNVVVLCHWFLV